MISYLFVSLAESVPLPAPGFPAHRSSLSALIPRRLLLVSSTEDAEVGPDARNEGWKESGQ